MCIRDRRKVKHMQNILKKEGLSNATMKENIDTFEDVPAYVRRNLSLNVPESKSESKLSKYTLTSDDNDEPVLRENNAYLNDNCLLYTSDAADDLTRVDLGGR